jgi:AcrR family transcriptional regulator
MQHRAEPARRRRLEERRAETRHLLLRSAAQLFARHGFDGVSLDAVADDAGFSKGAVYWHFANKQELLASVLELHCEGQLDLVRSMLAMPMTLDDRIDQVSSIYFTASDDAEGWCLLFVELWIQAMREPCLRPRLAQLYGATRAAVAEMIDQEAERLGTSLSVPAEEVAAGLMALGDGLLMQHVIGPNEATAKSYASVLRALFSALLRPQVAVSVVRDD